MSIHAHTDQNLLFGILALQMDFISRDALIKAMHAWVLDKAKPLSEILFEQGALSAERRTLLEALVAEHLKLHGNEAEKSLASVSTLDYLRQDLHDIADADIQASLAHVSMARQADADPFATRPPTVGESTSAGTRFRILRKHAKGGLGEVFVAQDQELHREVALKEIQGRYADHQQHRTRFVVEAEITGGLEHPGIVPVYSLGKYADGRPFYAMRFIKGDSLQEAIQRFHAAEGPRRDSSARAMAERDLLGRFVDVCNAIAYAHSRGVLHRDLKPGNIMLGAYGETLVVDWGLAKPLGGQATEENGTVLEHPLQLHSPGSSALTQTGSAIGTPAYMSPEQAAGRRDQLGPASDVYSLGATLYCLLTGKPPIIGKEVGEVLRRVQAGDFLRPRQVKREVPAALEAICLKAMALKPEERYRSAKALAEDVEHWLADEPVSAYREPLRVRTGRWARRHKSAVASITAVFLTAMLLGGGGFGWWQWQRTAAAQAAVVDLQKAEEVLQQRQDPTQARHALDRAEVRLGGKGLKHLRNRLQHLRDTADLVAQLEEARLQWSVSLCECYDYAGADKMYAAAFADQGLEVAAADPQEAAERIRASTVPTYLVEALDEWAFVKRQLEVEGAEPLLAVARLADEDLWRQQLREAAMHLDRGALEHLAEDRETLTQPSASLVLLCFALNNAGGQTAAERLLRQAQRDHPADFWINFELANNLYRKKSSELEESIGLYRAALALRPHNIAVYNNLATALREQGKIAESLDASHRAIALKPDDATLHTNLGITLEKHGKLAEALETHRNAIALQPDLCAPYINLGVSLARQGKLADAVDAHYKAIARSTNKTETAIAYLDLGNALSRLGRTDESIVCNRKALELKPSYAEAYCNLGLSFLRQGQCAEAVAALRRGHELGTKNPRWRYPSAQWLRQAERMANLEAKLPSILKGENKNVDANEQISLALLCHSKKRYLDAAHLFADAFAAQPKLAGDLKASHRYNAACSAALAVAGQGNDAAKLDDKERAHLGKQVLSWLRADLAVWSKQIEEGRPQDRAAAQRKLQHWQQDADLAGIRDAAALDNLPEAERADCRKLWDEVATLLKK